MPTIDATVYPDEAYVLVQADWSGTVYRQTFSTDSASNWPTADTGQTHTVQSGVAADFTSTGGTGFTTHGAAGTTKRISVDGVSMVDFNGTGTFTNFVVPTGANFEVGFANRWVDANNFVETRLFLMPSGTVGFSIRQVVAGVETNGGFPATTLPASGVYRWRFVGIGGSLFFRVWLDGTPEPLTWNGTFTTTFLTAGTIAYTTTLIGGVTNPMPVIFAFDNLVVVDPGAVTTDCAFVTRRNTVTGEVVRLRPYVFYDDDGALILECGIGLWWDTEPPLNVPLEYCTFACDTAGVLSGNTGFESGVTAPWVATGGVLTSSATFAHEGTSSGLLTPTGGVLQPSFTQTFAGILGSVPLTFSAWIMSPQGWNGVMLRMSLLYTNGITQIFDTPVEILDDGEWRFVSSTITPELNATATFSFIAMGAPPNTTLFYVDQIAATQPVDVTASACETVTVESDSVWLKNPLHPCLDVEVGLCNPMFDDCEQDSRVSYAGTSTQSYAPNSVLLSPANRRHLLPVNRIRRDASATLGLIAHDCDAKDAILAINEPGDPLLFQAPADYCIPDRYISVGVEEEGYIGRDQRDDFRLMFLPYETTDRPEGPADGVCGARITDLCDIYSSWGALTIAGFSWTDLLLGLASPNGPGQPAPPAAARDWDEVEAEFVDWDAVEAGGTRDWDELRDGL